MASELRPWDPRRRVHMGLAIAFLPSAPAQPHAPGTASLPFLLVLSISFTSNKYKNKETEGQAWDEQLCGIVQASAIGPGLTGESR